MLTFDKNKAAVEMIFEDNPMGLKKAALHFEEKVLKLENEKGAYVIPFGEEEPAETVFPATNLRTLSQGSWTDDHTFLVKLNVIEEEFSPVFLEFGFTDNNAVSAHFKNTSEPEFLRFFLGFAGGTWKQKRKIWTNRRNMIR